MYHQYFGLQEAPFSIAVNPRYLFMSSRHRDALAHLLYGVGAGGGFILLTGEVGTGKTTINRCFLEQLPDDTDVAMVMNPALNAQELLATVCDELHIEYGDAGLKSLTDALHGFLLQNYESGRKTVLMIDEAQHLSFDVLEQIRLLTNLETHTEKLLQIILIGQPELAQMLARPELRQLNQRITARYDLQALSLEETRAYINHRLQVAGLGASVQLFPANTVKRIHQLTDGTPRLINVLCDRVLLGAYGQGQNRASMALVKRAAEEVMGHSPAAGGGAFRKWSIAVAVLLLALLLGWQLMPRPVPGSTPASLGVADTVAPEPEPEPAWNWRMPEERLWPVFWSFYSPLALPEKPCSGEARYGLACYSASATQWQALAQLNRPLLLQLINNDVALLVGVSASHVYLYHPQKGVEPVLKEQLSGRWTGRYTALWQPPQGFVKALSKGDNKPVVARIAALFAQLDQQEKPLSDGQFTAALEQRVILFQRHQGLEDDGVIGARTLQALNIALGIDPNAEQIRSKLTQSVPQSEGEL